MVPNFYYPTNYPYMVPSYPQPYPQQQKTIIDRVQGEASVNVYPVQAGQEVILFDIDSPYVYRKERSLDNVLTQERFRLVKDEPTKPVTSQMDLSKYVTIEDVKEIISETVNEKMIEYVGIPSEKVKIESENVGNESEDKKGR